MTDAGHRAVGLHHQFITAGFRRHDFTVPIPHAGAAQRIVASALKRDHIFYLALVIDVAQAIAGLIRQRQRRSRNGMAIKIVARLPRRADTIVERRQCSQRVVTR